MKLRYTPNPHTHTHINLLVCLASLFSCLLKAICVIYIHQGPETMPKFPLSFRSPSLYFLFIPLPSSPSLFLVTDSGIIERKEGSFFFLFHMITIVQKFSHREILYVWLSCPAIPVHWVRIFELWPTWPTMHHITSLCDALTKHNGEQMILFFKFHKSLSSVELNCFFLFVPVSKTLCHSQSEPHCCAVTMTPCNAELGVCEIWNQLNTFFDSVVTIITGL